MTNFNNIPLVLTPFADADSSKDYSFFQSGVTRQMTVPTENGGARFTRHQMNGIGYLATLGAYLDRVGYPYGKERLDPTTFGGYPKGAILMTQENGIVREYVSLVDDNTHPLPTEEEDGTYVGNEWWAPTIPTESTSFYPNFSDVKFTGQITIGPIAYGKSAYQDMTISDTGWYSITRTFSNDSWGQIPLSGVVQLSQYLFSIEIQGDGLSNGVWVRLEQQDGILGATSTCLVPISKGNTIRFNAYNRYFDATNKTELYCKVVVRKYNSVELQ